ncbi:MAG: GNAT family N-acetyltransferase [Ruminococcus sp.]|nr:GNAT family N-acetyltransferase [Ruminococcus sp.]
MIRLRPFKPQDAVIISRFIGDDERAHMMFSAGRYEYPLKADEIISRHYGFEKENDAFMMTALDESGRVSGHFLYRLLDFERNSVHLGFIIIAPEKRGKGYGKEMITQALRYAHDTMGMERVTLGVFENNEAAYRCYLSCGFRVKNHVKDCFEFKDEKWGLYEMEYTFNEEDKK